MLDQQPRRGAGSEAGGSQAVRTLWRVGVVPWLCRFAAALVALLVAIVLSMVLYRWVDPPTTPTLAWRWLTGEAVDQRWVPLADISPNLINAVIAAEDSRFCRHRGIDFGELSAAIEESLEGNPRGASTITMQVVKNLYLWLDRSYLRKAIELPLALALDFVMPKRRILEIYLNLAEWAPGVYGAEAGAQYHFGRPARRLSIAEAARLAVTLPAPTVRDAGEPSARHQRLADRVAARVRAGVDAACLAR